MGSKYNAINGKLTPMIIAVVVLVSYKDQKNMGNELSDVFRE